MVERMTIKGLRHIEVFSPELFVWDPGKILLAGVGGVQDLLLTKLLERSGSRQCFFQCTFKRLAFEGPIGIYGSIKILTKAYPDSSGDKILIVIGRCIFKIRAYEGPIGIYGSTYIVTKAYPDSSGAIILTVFGYQTL